MKPHQTPREPFACIGMLLVVLALAWAAFAGIGVRSVEFDHCRAAIRVEGLRTSASDKVLHMMCAQLTGYRRSQLPDGQETGQLARRLTLEFEAASLTEATLRLTEWAGRFPPTVRVALEELTYHSVWLHRSRGNISVGMRQTLSTHDLDAAALAR